METVSYEGHGFSDLASIFGYFYMWKGLEEGRVVYREQRSFERIVFWDNKLDTLVYIVRKGYFYIGVFVFYKCYLDFFGEGS